MAEAKVNAQQELDKHRKQYEEEYQIESEKVSHTSLTLQKKKENDALVKLDEEAARDIEDIKANYIRNKAKVLEELIKKILDVNLDIPKVVIGKFE